MVREYRFTVTYSVSEGWDAETENVNDSWVLERDSKGYEYVEPNSFDNAMTDKLLGALETALDTAATVSVFGSSVFLDLPTVRV
jgi:hypothetical protein